MSQTRYVTEVSEFYEILLDDKLDNTNFQFINDDMVQMTYNFKDQFVDKFEKYKRIHCMFYHKPCQINVIQQAKLPEGESIIFRY